MAAAATCAQPTRRRALQLVNADRSSKVKEEVKIEEEKGDSSFFTPTEEQDKKYRRHAIVDLKSEKNLKRRRRLELQHRLNDEAVKRLAASECLLTEASGLLEPGPYEKTFAYKQEDILRELDIESKAKAFKLNLSGGPFHLDFTRNGRYLLSGGSQGGALSILDCTSLEAVTELHVNETIRDVCFLQNETMWAAAQKKYVYIYDQSGIELHCLREHMMTYRLEFLPYHFLLTTIGEFGELRYLDISTGLVPAAHKTKKGPCDAMCQNPFTGVILLGHTKGSVSLWTPNVGKPVVEFLAHGGKVTALKHLDANYCATAGLDGAWKIWDIRKFEELHHFRYFGPPPKTIDASQTGTIVGIGFGSHVQLWKDVTQLQKPKMPYLSHEIPGTQVESLRFRPYEDFCYLGTGRGLESIVVPGSGFANFHSHTADPYETTKQRQEREIHGLLEKLPADTITFDPSKLGHLDEAPPVVLCEEAEAKRLKLEEEKKAKRKSSSKLKASTAAREKAQKKQYADLIRRKTQRRLQEEALGLREPILKEDDVESAVKMENGTSSQETADDAGKKVTFSALDRFKKKKSSQR